MLDSLEQLRLLVNHHAFEKRSVTLASGKQSDFYIDCRKVSLSPKGGFLIGQLFFSAIQSVASKATAVGGMTMGADPIVTATTVASYIGGNPLQSFYVRKEAKQHGTGRQLECSYGMTKSNSVVLVEDVVTTGGSTKKAYDAVTKAGHSVVAIVSLFDRQEGGATLVKSLAPYYALLRREDLS